jgi:hypothetical protein
VLVGSSPAGGRPVGSPLYYTVSQSPSSLSKFSESSEIFALLLSLVNSLAATPDALSASAAEAVSRASYIMDTVGLAFRVTLTKTARLFRPHSLWSVKGRDPLWRSIFAFAYSCLELSYSIFRRDEMSRPFCVEQIFVEMFVVD